MIAENKGLTEALLSQKQLTGTELSLKDGERYFRDLTEAILFQSKALNIEMNENQAREMALHIIAKVDISNPVVGHKGFHWLAKLFIPIWEQNKREGKTGEQ